MSALLRFKPGAVGQYYDGPLFDGNCVEVHESTCSHCQNITAFPSLRKMMDHVEICRGCMRLICLRCAGKPCRPFEAEAERQEKEAQLRAKVAAQGWGCY